MRASRGVIGSFLASSSAKGLRALLRIGILLIAARAFTLGDVGQFAFVLGLGTLLFGVLDLGVTSLLQREVSFAETSVQIEGQALRLKLLTLPFGVGVGWVAASTVSPGLGFSSVGVLLLAAAVATVDFTAGIRRARGQFELEIHELAAPAFGCLLTGLAVVLLEGDIAVFEWATGLVTGLLAGQRLWVLEREISAFDDNPGHVSVRLRSLLWKARWFWLMGVGALVLFEAPTILLQVLSTEEAVALYATAMRTVGLASQPYVVVAAVFVPSLAYESVRSKDLYFSSIRRLNDLLVVGYPSAIAAGVLGGILFLGIAGPEYAQAKSLLLFLALGTLLYLGAPNAGPLIVEGVERLLALVVATSATATILLCLVLIPSTGAEGAALAALAGFAVGKIGHGILYLRLGLPVCSRTGWLGVFSLVFWAVTTSLSTAGMQAVVFNVGAAVSLVFTVYIMRKLRVFRSVAGEEICESQDCSKDN